MVSSSSLPTRHEVVFVHSASSASFFQRISWSSTASEMEEIMQVRTLTGQPSVENRGEKRSSAGRGCAVKLSGKSWHRDEEAKRDERRLVSCIPLVSSVTAGKLR